MIKPFFVLLSSLFLSTAVHADKPLSAIIRESCAEQLKRSFSEIIKERNTSIHVEADKRITSLHEVQISGSNYREIVSTMDRLEFRPHSVYGRNSKYKFFLLRDGYGWGLKSLGASVHQNTRQIRASSIEIGVSDCDLTYIQILDLPSAKVISDRVVDWRNKPHRELFLTFQLDTEPILQTNKFSSATTALSVFVDPARPSLIRGYRRYQSEHKQFINYDQTVEYVDEMATYPDVKKVLTYQYFENESSLGTLTRICEVESRVLSSKPLDDKDFTLPPFGIAEPEEIPKTERTFALESEKIAGRNQLDIPNFETAEVRLLKSEFWIELIAILVVILLPLIAIFILRRRPR